MKHLLITLWLSVGLSVLAQGAVPSHLKTRITDDSRTLSIQINSYKNGQAIQYNRTFDVAGKNTLQKEVLKYRAFKSVGLVVPLHEITGLLSTILGVSTFTVTLLLFGYQARKSAYQSVAKHEQAR